MSKYRVSTVIPALHMRRNAFNGTMIICFQFRQLNIVNPSPLITVSVDKIIFFYSLLTVHNFSCLIFFFTVELSLY